MPLRNKRRAPVEEGDRVLVAGRPDVELADNSICTSKYTIFTFLPISLVEQFRRVANMYFLIIGIIMAIGYYTPAFDSAISPWTTLGPLAIVLAVSMLQEGISDMARHRSDDKTNKHPCVVLRRADELDAEKEENLHLGKNKKDHMLKGNRDPTVLNGHDVTVDMARSYFFPSGKGPEPNTTPTANHENNSNNNVGGSDSCKVAFESVMRQDIGAGHFVLIRNRDMVPADIILLASSSDNGSSYIETSSIDGETNLKLRTSPHLPNNVREDFKRQSVTDIAANQSDDGPHVVETLEQATRRIARFSALAYPNGISAVDNPANPPPLEEEDEDDDRFKRKSLRRRGSDALLKVQKNIEEVKARIASPMSSRRMGSSRKYVTALTSEPPNASVNTYSGKLTLPPVEADGPSIDIPLNADNILLRGAVLRNTEWAIGLVCFTGVDTKLVQNSFDPPSKFSQLDKLMNRTVLVILAIMMTCIVSLAGLAMKANDEHFDELWYLGWNKDTTEKWKYLPPEFEAPKWETEPPAYFQSFFLYVTLLSNFVPLSLYVTVEIITFFLIWLINVDKDMYYEKTDTRAVARSPIVTDLGQVQYVFSDKTGTLTQNVMRFKRCSVDGMVFGAPVEKFRQEEDVASSTSLDGPAPFHPLRQLLVGRVQETPGTNGPRRASAGLMPPMSEDVPEGETGEPGDKLTFNAEMFLRVLSICHTVVVEKEFEPNIMEESGAKSVSSQSSALSSFGQYAKKFFSRRERSSSDMSLHSSTTPHRTPLGSVDEVGPVVDGLPSETNDKTRDRVFTFESLPPAGKGPDGSPAGYVYQAESPDEGALVSAASINFDYQVVGRDSSGVKLSVLSPSLLQDEHIVEGLKDKSLSPKSLAAETASGVTVPREGLDDEFLKASPKEADMRSETWTILAINKFDSERKRMSVLVRSPPELGSIPMLLCKGADSAMLDPKVCSGADNLMTGEETEEDVLRKSLKSPTGGIVVVSEDTDSDGEELQDDWEMAAMLGIQAHLGDFAKEGLRTLVLGMRILTEEECEDWLTTYKLAATSIKNRDEKLQEAAFEIERDLHIVGATAIEDKLQSGVPETISILEKAGIKLWVLTGDKRETAIEIGYATHVLTPKMHLTEVADGLPEYVRTQMAMEFIRLVKMGKLPQYQHSVLDRDEKHKTFADHRFSFGKFRRRCSRAIRRFLHRFVKPIFIVCCGKREGPDPALTKIDEEEIAENERLSPTAHRRAVRDRADKTIQDYLQSPDGMKHRSRRKPAHVGEVSDEELSLASDEVPGVFSRATSARVMLDIQRAHGRLADPEVRTLSIAQLTTQQLGVGEAPVVDEDMLSLQSFFPGENIDTGDFDRKKRTLLERMFAVDSDVRHGRLVKHVKKEKLASIKEEQASIAEERAVHPASHSTLDSHEQRGLVIEGAALVHLLGDELLEEMLFGVASNCDAVIACRVSPKQKALVVKLVRCNVKPEPITLAIGDGANDVGMIQEAHVGVGISGLEGQQAVNASDFSIAQFRYLEELCLIHGRWNFLRMSTVVLYSFYKNACMAGCLIVYSGQTLYSGTTLFDQWVIAMLNFVAAIPIIFLGFFDRCLEKDYIRKNPDVYGPGRNNELMTFRILFRWVLLTCVSIFALYYISVPPQTDGGGITPAFYGLMSNEDHDAPGEGEGADLKSVGLVVFTNLILLLAWKVLYESRSLLHGEWPPCTCRKGVGETFWNRLAYTWIGVFILSIGFYLFGIGMYAIVARNGNYTGFTPFTGAVYHVLQTRSITWMLFILVPTAGTAFDVAGKLFSNLFFPTQTQIHLEIAGKQIEAEKMRRWMPSNFLPTKTRQTEEV